ncbi:MAG: RimK family alpha-L-glutamate ligase [Acidobacteriota bacterium]
MSAGRFDIDVALATCAALPEPDPDAVPLTAALQDAGLAVTTLAWDAADSDWARASMTVLRSTWNYPLRPEAFRAWLEQVARATQLWNPLSAVRWNLHKSYLLDLARDGIEVTPTRILTAGSGATLSAVTRACGWQDVVVKPAISAASFRTQRIRPGDGEAGEAHLRDLLATHDVLVQPYLPSVEDHGERALVWIDGALTHAIRKTPRFSGQDESVSGESMPISPDEARLARSVLSHVEDGLLYARVDVAPGLDGRPVIMELELIEPSLFFPQSDEALQRFVAGVRRRLDALRSGERAL